MKSREFMRTLNLEGRPKEIDEQGNKTSTTFLAIAKEVVKETPELSKITHEQLKKLLAGIAVKFNEKINPNHKIRYRNVGTFFVTIKRDKLISGVYSEHPMYVPSRYIIRFLPTVGLRERIKGIELEK